MTIKLKPIEELTQANYNPVIFAFLIKTLIFGAFMAFFGFHLHPTEIHNTFPQLPSGETYTLLGWGFLLFSGIGAYGLYKRCSTAKNVFLMGGIIFASAMASTLLFVDIFSINGVSYVVDALVLVWIFIHNGLRMARL